MLNDLMDSQTIIVYDPEGVAYDGKVGDMPEDVRQRLDRADFYLLDKCEDFDVIAIF